jgi:hypothetical protein
MHVEFLGKCAFMVTPEGPVLWLSTHAHGAESVGALSFSSISETVPTTLKVVGWPPICWIVARIGVRCHVGFAHMG